MNKQKDKKKLMKAENQPIGNLTEEDIRILFLDNTKDFDDKFCMEDLVIMKRAKHVLIGFKYKK